MNNAITRPVGWIGDSIDRNTRRTVNGLRLLSGLDRPRTGCTPHLAVWREDRPSLHRLPSSFGGKGGGG